MKPKRDKRAPLASQKRKNRNVDDAAQCAIIIIIIFFL